MMDYQRNVNSKMAQKLIKVGRNQPYLSVRQWKNGMSKPRTGVVRVANIY